MGVEQKVHCGVRQGHFGYGRSSRLGDLHVFSLIGTDIGPYCSGGMLNLCRDMALFFVRASGC